MNPDVLSFCREHHLFSPGDRVICAVSGGADSMAMLHFLFTMQQELKITVSAAHFNHCLRGAESDGDEVFVREFCALRGIPFTSVNGNVKAYAAQTGVSLEEAARKLRYDFLMALPGDRVATAHNADDNGETVLLHLLRGSGLRGLCGIPVKNGRLVRPLLSVTRKDILAYLQQEGIPWREDSTNGEDFCRRNRLRHHVLPLLEAEAPGFSRRLTAQSALLRSEDEYLDAAAAPLLKKVGGGYAIAPILSAPPALRRRALRLILRQQLPQDVSLRHIDGVLALLQGTRPSACLSLPGGVTVQRCYDTLLITKAALPPIDPCNVEVGSTVALPASDLSLSCCRGIGWSHAENTPLHFALRCNIPTDALLLRPRQTGDSLLLANGHRRSLKKLFIDRKIPRQQRDQLAVLVSGEQVLAVPGVELSQDVLALPGQPALLFEVSPLPEQGNC